MKSWNGYDEILIYFLVKVGAGMYQSGVGRSSQYLYVDSQ